MLEETMKKLLFLLIAGALLSGGMGLQALAADGGDRGTHTLFIENATASW